MKLLKTAALGFTLVFSASPALAWAPSNVGHHYGTSIGTFKCTNQIHENSGRSTDICIRFENGLIRDVLLVMPRGNEEVENGYSFRNSEANLIRFKCNAPSEVSYLFEAQVTITGQFAPRKVWKMFDVKTPQIADKAASGRIKYFSSMLPRAYPDWDPGCKTPTDYKIVNYMDTAGGFGPWQSVWSSTNENAKFMDKESGKKLKWKN